jgi:hypothetical protein
MNPLCIPSTPSAQHQVSTSGDPQPSEEDRLLTRTIVQAADIIGIRVLEHLIITMDNDQYFSFADQGLIEKTYSEVGRTTIAHRIVDHIFS